PERGGYVVPGLTIPVGSCRQNNRCCRSSPKASAQPYRRPRVAPSRVRESPNTGELNRTQAPRFVLRLRRLIMEVMFGWAGNPGQDFDAIRSTSPRVGRDLCPRRATNEASSSLASVATITPALCRRADPLASPSPACGLARTIHLWNSYRRRRERPVSCSV